MFDSHYIELINMQHTLVPTVSSNLAMLLRADPGK